MSPKAAVARILKPYVPRCTGALHDCSRRNLAMSSIITLEATSGYQIEPVTDDMIEQESLTCEEPTRIISKRSARQNSSRGTACLAGNFTVSFDTFAGEIHL